MSMNFVTNYSGTGSQCMYQLLALLVAAGWTVPRSSDGTTYNPSGNQITSGNTGAGGLANTNAWFCIKMPTAGSTPREWCFQRTTGNTLWRIKYSTASGGFNAGSPSATRVPAASAEAIMWGSGTDVSPTGIAFFSTDNSYWFQGGADNAAPYGCWFASYSNSGRAMQSALMVDPVTGITGDTDPYVYYVLGNTTTFGVSNQNGATSTDMNNSSTPPFKAWFFLGLTGESFASLNAWTYGVVAGTTNYTVAMPGGLNLDGWTSLDDNAPVPYGRPLTLGAPVGFKGISTLMQYVGPGRNTADTQGSLSRIVLKNVSLPWDGATTPQ